MNHLKTLKRIAVVALMIALGFTNKLSAQTCPESGVITITVNPVLELDTDLSVSPVLVCVGGTQTLTVTAKGGTTTAPNFQWQVRTAGSTTWTNYTDAVTTSGLTSSITPDNSAASAVGIKEYQVIITDPSGTSNCGVATSKMATIEVKPDISIATDLTALSFVECIGGARKLVVNATGGSTVTALTYVWEETTTNPTSGTPTWTTVQTGPSNEYMPTHDAAAAAIGTRYYRVRVEEPSGNGCGNQTSTTFATVRVTPDLTFSNAPLANIVQCTGGTDTWTVSTTGGTGGTLTYKWEQSASASGPWADATGTNNAATYAPANAAGTTMFYRVTVRDAESGCDALELSTPVSSTIHAKPTVVATVNEQVICKDGTVTFSANITNAGAPGCALEWKYKEATSTTWLNVPNPPAAPGTSYTTPTLTTGAGNTQAKYDYKVVFNCAASGCCN
jgi:hypothetical protein